MKVLFQKQKIPVYRKVLNKEKAKRAEENLLKFILYTKPDYSPSRHNEFICEKLDNFLASKSNNRLMIFTAPRHGKSEIVSRRLPAYILGKKPDTKIIACSYSADLAQRMNRDVQRIIDDPLYREIFPNTTLSGSNVRTSAQGSYLRNSDIFEVVGNTGVYRSAGVGGGITGMGFSVGIIDDPFKNWQEANSLTVRNAVFEWFCSTFYTRGEKIKDQDCKIIIIMTRWHEDDLAGRIIKQMEDGGEQWEIINLPALYEKSKYNCPEDWRREGQALWPSRYNEEKLQTIKKTIGSYLFNALYQQRPSPPEGSILQRSWWKFYKEIPVKFDEIIQSWDCTFKDANDTDFVVGQVWGRIGADKYLLDQVRARMGFIDTITAIRTLTAKWPKARLKLIEDKANGPAIIETLKKEIPGIVPVNPKGSKVERVYSISPDVEAGNVYLPSSARWLHDFIEECSAFPSSTNDDQVDALSQALQRFSGRKFNTSMEDIKNIISVPRRTADRVW